MRTLLVFRRVRPYNTPRMRPTNPRASRVGDVLSDVLKRVDPEQQMDAYRIWTFWNDEVGAAIARRAQPSGFRNGILFVTVAAHSWMQELQFLKAKIRDQLNARLGTERVRDIYFVSGTVNAPSAADAPTPDMRVPPGRRFVPLPVMPDTALAEAFARVVDARARRLTQGRRATSGKRQGARRKP